MRFQTILFFNQISVYTNEDVGLDIHENMMLIRMKRLITAVQ